MERAATNQRSTQVRLAQVAAVSAALVGALAVTGRLAAVPWLSTWGLDTVALPPMSGLLAFTAGMALWPTGPTPSRRRLALAPGVAGSLLALAVIALRLRGTWAPFELLWAQPAPGLPTGAAGGSGLTSPGVAICLLAANASALLLGHPANAGNWRAKGAVGLGAVVVTDGFVLLMLATFQLPFLGTAIGAGLPKPPLLTAPILLLLGSATLVRAVPRAWASADSAQARQGSIVLTAIFAGVAFVTLAAAYGYFRNEERELLEDTAAQLEVVVNLKLAQLAAWRSDQLQHAAFLLRDAELAGELLAATDGHQHPAAAEEWAWLTSERYDQAFLIDAQGTTRMSFPSATEPLPVALASEVAAALKDGTVNIVEYVAHTERTPSAVAVVAPIQPATRKGPAGVLVLRVDAAKLLFASFSRWPNDSPTGEVLLVRRHRGAVEYLTPLRFAPIAGRDSQELLADSSLPDVSPVLVGAGFANGRDYRGVPVAAVVRQVPESTWAVMAKIDVAEINDLLWRRLLVMTAAGIMLLTSVGAGLGAVWNAQRARFHARQASLDVALQSSEARLRQVVASAGQGLWDLDCRTGSTVVSNEYAALLGHDPATFVESRDLWDRRMHADDRARVVAAYHDHLAGRSVEYRAEFRTRAADGQWKWVLTTGRVVERGRDGTPHRVAGTLTDIDLRKRAELKADRLAHLYEALTLCNEAIVRSESPEDLFPLVCQAAAGCVSMAWIGLLAEDGRRVLPTACAGDHLEYLTDIDVTVDGSAPSGLGPVGTAIRDNKPCWIQDFAADERSEYWRGRAQAAGWGACGALPLQRHGQAIGALSLYSTTAGAFDQDTIGLLEEMAADVNFALDGFERDARRREAERLVQDNERRYRAMFAEGAVPMLLVDPATGVITDANEAASRFYGWDLGRLREMSLSEINVEGASRVITELQRAVDGGGAHLDLQHRAADGSVRDVEAYSSRLVVNGATRVLATVFDVTARKQAEADRTLANDQVQRSQALLNSVIGGTTDAVFVKDRNGRYQLFNEAAGRVIGKPPGDIIGLDDSAIFPPDQAASIQAHDLAVMDGPGVVTIIEQLTDASGVLRTFQATKGPIHDATGAVTGLFGVSRDISEQARMEAALRASEAHYRSLFRNMMNGYLFGRLIVEDGQPVDILHLEVNPAYAQLIGFANVSGRRASDVLSGFPGRQDRHLLQRIATTVDTSIPQQFESYVSAIDRWVAVSVYTPRPGHFVALFADISERRKADAAVRSSLKEKEALLKEVHHRVKNNLQIVTSLLRLESGRSTDQQVTRVLGEMQNRVLSMALLHETLYRSDNLAQVDLSLYLSQLCGQLFRVAAPRSGIIRLHLDLAPVRLELDRAVPCGLLVNELVSNALKHAFGDDRSGEVRVSLQPADGGASLDLCVADTGVGLPADFEARRASSLGLQLVSDLARQLRGTVAATSASGTMFTVTFPFAPLSRPAADLPAPERPS